MQIRETATIEYLYDVPENGKAELVSGELVVTSPTGGKPSRAGRPGLDVYRGRVVRVVRPWIGPRLTPIYANNTRKIVRVIKKHLIALIPEVIHVDPNLQSD